MVLNVLKIRFNSYRIKRFRYNRYTEDPEGGLIKFAELKNLYFEAQLLLCIITYLKSLMFILIVRINLINIHV